MPKKVVFQKLSGIFSDASIAEKPTLKNCYASPVFESILNENSDGNPIPKLISKTEFSKNQERDHILKNIYAYKMEFGVEKDFYKKSSKSQQFSTLKRMKGGVDDTVR